MRVLTFGTYDQCQHPRVAVIVDGLRAAGHQVDECNVPLGLSTARRVQMLQQPWRLPWLLARLLRCWAALTVLAVRSGHASPPDVVFVGYLGHFDVVLARALFPKLPIVLDHLVSASDTAADRGERGRVKQMLLRALDHVALRCADLVVVDTVEHCELLPKKQRDKAVVVLVGATNVWRSTRTPSRQAHDPLRVVFFGLFTPLQGTPTIGKALALLADNQAVTATLCGAGQDLANTRQLAASNPRVRFIPWMEPGDLPGMLAEHDVCLGIFGTGPKARRVVPTKVYQGAAAGCALITSDTLAQRRVLGNAALFVPPGDANALASALEWLAANRRELATLQERAATLARTAFTPGVVVEPLLTRLLAQPTEAAWSHA